MQSHTAPGVKGFWGFADRMREGVLGCNPAIWEMQVDIN